ncbi:MAG: SpvB/TcaC N-terminal domain-containing protein [Chloroflexota bacterium]
MTISSLNQQQSTPDKSVNSRANDAAPSLQIPTIDLPRGGGAIRSIGEKFSANPVTVFSSMSVPIATSPGRAGFGLQLALSYDSGSGNSAFGFGWGLTLPAITRKTDKGLPRYLDAEESDVYILSGAEDLVPALDANGSRFIDTTTAPAYAICRYYPRVEASSATSLQITLRSAHFPYWTQGLTRQATHFRSVYQTTDTHGNVLLSPRHNLDLPTLPASPDDTEVITIPVSDNKMKDIWLMLVYKATTPA